VLLDFLSVNALRCCKMGERVALGLSPYFDNCAA
jgi:hypothetical protein